MMRAVGGVLAGATLVLAWLAIPTPVAAWGPGTHVALGEALLASLYLLPPAVRALLERYPLHFLYGSVAADISFAKKYAPVGRHCHHWPIGEEILAEARSEPLAAVGYGYLAHLAADTIAHNVFVPRQLLLTSTTQSVGHTYWEHRMDMHVGEEFSSLARHVVMEHDHSEADRLFDDVLSRTLFSFRTNRRIFRGMIRFQGDERWQQVFSQLLASSRFDLPSDEVDRYFARSFDFVVGYLRDRDQSPAAALDPIGDLNLKLAKKVRRRAMSDPSVDHGDALLEMADEFFPLTNEPLEFWPEVTDPQFAAGISATAGVAGRALGGALPAADGSRPDADGSATTSEKAPAPADESRPDADDPAGSAP